VKRGGSKRGFRAAGLRVQRLDGRDRARQAHPSCPLPRRAPGAAVAKAAHEQVRADQRRRGERQEGDDRRHRDDEHGKQGELGDDQEEGQGHDEGGAAEPFDSVVHAIARPASLASSVTSAHRRMQGFDAGRAADPPEGPASASAVEPTPPATAVSTTIDALR
jgi:hypothetical protein